jgi:hypothetical protein
MTTDRSVCEPSRRLDCWHQRVRLYACSVIWTILALAGMLVLVSYQNAPGQIDSPPALWPSDGFATARAGLPRLVMFAHPRCPCTRASIGELARLMARCQGQVTASVFFFNPAGFGEAWCKTDLWRSAETIPGVTVHSDLDGCEARHFGAATSGYTLLYDRSGRLLFHGGITAGRGHRGDNAGSDAILAALDQPTETATRTAVFGCGLLDPACRNESEGGPCRRP